MKKYIVLLGLIAYIFFLGSPPSLDEDRLQTLYDGKDRIVALKEIELTAPERIKRFFNFKEAVQEAIERKISPEEYVPGPKIPLMLKEAVVATEDRRFYVHGAVDLIGISRAVYTNVEAGETLQGGSTLTQQLVKNLFLSPDRTISRKAEELILSILMEYYYSKDEILTMYLNTIYYGNTYYGIKEASEGYYGVKPMELNIAEIAMLAGLPQAPSYYNPKEHPLQAQQRRKVVLQILESRHIITKEEEAVANSAPL